MINKILVIQSSSRGLTAFREKLNDEYSDYQVDILTTSGGSFKLNSSSHWDNIFFTEQNNLSSLSSHKLKELKAKEYQQVIVLMNSINSTNYSEIEKLALNIAKEKTILFDQTGNKQEYGQTKFRNILNILSQLKKNIIHYLRKLLKLLLELYLIFSGTFRNLFKNFKKLITSKSFK